MSLPLGWWIFLQVNRQPRSDLHGGLVGAAVALLDHAVDELGDGHGASIVSAAVADGDLFSFDFAIPDDEHVGGLLELGVTDHVAHALAGGIDIDSEAVRTQLALDVVGEVDVAVGDGDDHGLDR